MANSNCSITSTKDPAVINLPFLQEYLNKKRINLIADKLTLEEASQVLEQLKTDLDPGNVYFSDQYSTLIQLYSRAYSAIQCRYNIGNNL